MRMLHAIGIAVALVGGSNLAASAGETLPASAKKATMEEFKSLADGKTVSVEIFDLGKPVTATLVWDFDKETITGKALVDGKDKVDVKTKLIIKGEKACSQSGKDEPTCHVIYIDGDKFYEVRDDGGVHAVSTIQG